jgi:hypothetical protein
MRYAAVFLAAVSVAGAALPSLEPMHWPGSAAAVAAARLPALFEPSLAREDGAEDLISTIAAQAAAQWNPEVLHRTLQQIRVKTQHHDPVFRYHSKAALMSAPERHTATTSFVSAATFLWTGRDPFAYATIPMTSWPHPFPPAKTFAAELEIDPEMNLWLAGAGVTAQLHYDTSHNFFVPVSGRKRVLLLPPAALSRAMCGHVL